MYICLHLLYFVAYCRIRNVIVVVVVLVVVVLVVAVVVTAVKSCSWASFDPMPKKKLNLHIFSSFRQPPFNLFSLFGLDGLRWFLISSSDLHSKSW